MQSNIPTTPSTTTTKVVVATTVALTFITFWQANLASCISTAAGILQFPARRFVVLAFIAQTLWFGFWAALIFLLGPAALSLAGFRMILLLILIWIAARLIYRWKFEKQTVA